MTNKKQKILEAKQYAILNGGVCISEEYIGTKEKLEWKCSNPTHPSWFSSFDNAINRKRWCPSCGKESSIEKRKKKDGLEQAQLYAISKEGSCLSTEYIGARKN